MDTTDYGKHDMCDHLRERIHSFNPANRHYAVVLPTVKNSGWRQKVGLRNM